MSDPQAGEKPLSWAMMFPEILWFVAILVFSPVWCMRLVQAGTPLYGGLVVVLALVGASSFGYFAIKGRRIAAWVIVGATVLVFVALHFMIPGGMND